MLKNEEQKAKEIFRIHIDGSPRDQKVLDGFFFFFIQVGSDGKGFEFEFN